MNQVLGGGMLPFLDIVFSLVGIFLVVFVLQSIAPQPQQGLAGVDELILCEDRRELRYYPHPGADPVSVSSARLEILFTELAPRQTVVNLSFAFNQDCFSAKASFERAFAEFSQSLERDGALTRRLNFRPLSSEAGAGEALLARWRGESP